MHRAGTVRIYACGHDVRRSYYGKCADVGEARSRDEVGVFGLSL